MIPETKVLPFDFIVTVPLQKYTNYVDPAKNIGRGTMPDYPVNLTIDDIVKGEDRVLNFTVDLIKKSSQ